MSTALKDKSSEKSKEFRMIGNEFFRKGEFYDALKFYNKASCYAITMEDHSLAAGNRSAVFIELKLYPEVICNTGLALQAYPKDKVAKILERQEKANEVMFLHGLWDTPSFTASKEFIKLSHAGNPKIPYIANCLKMKTDDVFGRGIYTTRNLNPGDIIAIENIRIFHIMDAYHERCGMCFGTGNLDLIPSEISTNLQFCTPECRLKGENNLVVYFGRKPLSLDKIRLDLNCPKEFHYIAMQANENNGQKTIFDYDWSNLNANDKALDELYTICFYGLNSLFSKTDESFQFYQTSLASILMANKLPLNFYDVRNDGNLTKEQAICCLLFGSLINHSCDPNVMRFEFDRKMVFYAAKPIKKGEQLFMSYFVETSFLAENRKQRRETLKKEYGFDCQCTACKLNYTVITESDFSKPKNVKEMTVIEAIKEFKENNEILKTDFTDYRDEKAQYLIHRNVRLMHLVSAYKILPFNN